MTYGRTGQRADLQLIATGEWAKVGRKHYKHVSGIEVEYDCNHWVWKIWGGAEDGNAYQTLTTAAYFATK